MGGSGQQKHNAGSYPLFHQPRASTFLPRAALNSFIPQSVLVLGIASIQLKDLALYLIEFHEIFVDPLLMPARVTLEGMMSPPSSKLTASLSLVSSANVLRVPSIPLMV